MIPDLKNFLGCWGLNPGPHTLYVRVLSLSFTANLKKELILYHLSSGCLVNIAAAVTGQFVGLKESL
jgi:hypothetical protein